MNAFPFDPSLHGSRPLANSYSKPAFKLFFFVVSIFFSFKMSQTLFRLPQSGSFHTEGIRLTVLANRGGGPANQSAIASLGLLQDGCRLLAWSGPRPAALPLRLHGGTFEVRFDCPQLANGYYFVTSEGPPAADPVAWLVESFDGAAWRPMGASTEIIWPRGGHTVPRDLHPTVPYATPVGRGQVVAVDHRPTLPRFLEVLTACIGTLCMCTSLVVSVASMEQWVRPIWAVAFTSSVLVYGFTAVWFHCIEQHHAAFVYWAMLVNPALVAFALAFREHDIIWYFMLFLPMQISTRILSRLLIFSDYWNQTTLVRWLLFDSPFLPKVFLGFAVPCLRQWALLKSRRLILGDQRRYDEAWALTLSDPSAKG